MAGPCSGDPVACIDFVILFIAEFLKDWTTLAMLAILLGLLLRLRADRRKAREEVFARQVEAYAARMKEESGQVPTWAAERRRPTGPSP